MSAIDGLSLYWNTKCKSRIDMSFDDVVVSIKYLNFTRLLCKRNESSREVNLNKRY